MSRPDSAIVAEVLAGDRKAFRELVARYQEQMIASAHHLVGDRDAAQDLAQEAFVSAYVELESLRNPSRFRQWLYGILRHKCLSHLRAQGQPVASWEQDVDEEYAVLSGPEERIGGELVDALNALPLKWRELLSARYLQDMTYGEMAEMLGTTVNNVRVQCCRAKQALRAVLASRPGASCCQAGAAPTSQECGREARAERRKAAC